MKYKNEIIAFSAGFLIMALEVAGARALYPLFGSSLIIWTTIIGIFMAALALGYYVGGKEENSAKVGNAIIYTSIITALVPLITLTNASSFPLLFLYAGIISIPAFALAMVSPHIVGKLKRKAGEAAGYVYGISTLGSIAGTFIIGFFTLPFLGVAITLFITSALSALLGFWLSKNINVAIPLIIILLLLPLNHGIPTYYHTAEIINIKDVRYLLMDRLPQSALNLSNFSNPVFCYTKIMKSLAENKSASTIAIIGAGGCSQLHHMRSLFPKATIYVVDIDAKVFDICKEYFYADDANPVFVLEDGRKFLEEHKDTFDIVILDAYGSGCSVPPHMITKEFFLIARQSLKDNGLFMANIILNDDKEVNNAFKNSIAYAFPNVALIPCGNKGPRNVVFYAYKTHSYGVERTPIITDDRNPVEFKYSLVCLK